MNTLLKEIKVSQCFYKYFMMDCTSWRLFNKLVAQFSKYTERHHFSMIKGLDKEAIPPQDDPSLLQVELGWEESLSSNCGTDPPSRDKSGRGSCSSPSLNPQWTEPREHNPHCIYNNPWILADHIVALSLKRIRIIRPSLQTGIN